MDVSGAIAIAAAGEFDSWLREHGAVERQVVVAIVKRTTGRATVSLLELQEVALCHGWVDTQTQRLDGERYAIRFAPRRPRSSWGPKNRAMARRLLADGRLTDRAMATLPEDL